MTSAPDQGIPRAGRGEEPPKDKEHARTARKTEPSRMSAQPVRKHGGEDKS